MFTVIILFYRLIQQLESYFLTYFHLFKQFVKNGCNRAVLKISNTHETYNMYTRKRSELRYRHRYRQFQLPIISVSGKTQYRYNTNFNMSMLKNKSTIMRFSLKVNWTNHINKTTRYIEILIFIRVSWRFDLLQVSQVSSLQVGLVYSNSEKFQALENTLWLLDGIKLYNFIPCIILTLIYPHRCILLFIGFVTMLLPLSLRNTRI